MRRKGWWMRRNVHLLLHEQICARRERMFWPRRTVRLHPRRMMRAHWRNALAFRLGYKAHRACVAGLPLHNPDVVRAAGLKSWEAATMLPSEVWAAWQAKQEAPQ